MRSRTLTAVALVLVCGLPIRATAQENARQTSDSAQRFLRLILPQRFTFTYPPGRPFGATRLSQPVARNQNCATAFQVDAIPELTIPVSEHTIRWDKVSETNHEAGATAVTLHFRYDDGIPYLETFDFGSPALADRAAYAMEFLRVECDPAAQTGF